MTDEPVTTAEVVLREPDLPRTAKVRPHALRTGWTTGACTTAATTAAVTALTTGTFPDQVEITLPSGRVVAFPVARCELLPAGAEAVVVKDAGDDPDVTHGAELTATVTWSEQPGVHLRAGAGVGTVTKEGLGLPVGGPAINDTPRRMITDAVTRLVDVHVRGVQVVVSVPGGEVMAR